MSSPSQRKNRPRLLFRRSDKSKVKQQDLLCKNGCGFYGNPEWNWYCSKCWREQNQAKKSHNRTSPSSLGSSKSPVKVNLTSPKRNNLSSAEYSNSSSEFASVLNNSKAALVDVSRQLKAFTDRLQRAFEDEEQEIDDISNLTQEFYRNLRRRLDCQECFRKLSHEDKDKVMDLAEKYVVTANHRILFCPAKSDDEDKDLQIQSRIRKLNWISAKDLGCAIADDCDLEHLHSAVDLILEMDGQVSPQEKLDRLVKCSKSVFDLLRSGQGQSQAGADEFLPCLVFVCLKANPPRLHSNVNFITRFRDEEKIRTGEAGYLFASLCCAVAFIENMTADSLNMDPEEFESYVEGRAVPPGSWQSSLLMCESVQTVNASLKRLKEIRRKQEELTSEAASLHAQMETFRAEISEQVSAVLKRTRYTIKGEVKKAAVAPDFQDEQTISSISTLPAPLIPVSVSPVPEAASSAPVSASASKDSS